MQGVWRLGTNFSYSALEKTVNQSNLMMKTHKLYLSAWYLWIIHCCTTKAKILLDEEECCICNSNDM